MALPVRPTRLRPYGVIVKIAGGGMATIYLGRARGLEGGGRLVALKAIRHDFRHDERFIHMFRKEAAILSRLSHPNIAATYEVGMEEDQHFAIIQAARRTHPERRLGCVQGSQSHLAARSRGLDRSSRRRRAPPCARADRGNRRSDSPLVHRDVNPSNVF